MKWHLLPNTSPTPVQSINQVLLYNRIFIKSAVFLSRGNLLVDPRNFFGALDGGGSPWSAVLVHDDRGGGSRQSPTCCGTVKYSMVRTRAWKESASAKLRTSLSKSVGIWWNGGESFFVMARSVRSAGSGRSDGWSVGCGIGEGECSLARTARSEVGDADLSEPPELPACRVSIGLTEVLLERVTSDVCCSD